MMFTDVGNFHYHNLPSLVSCFWSRDNTSKGEFISLLLAEDYALGLVLLGLSAR